MMDSPIDERLLTYLHQVRRPQLSVTLSQIFSCSGRTLRWHLLKLEAAGRVARPKGERSGWVAVREPVAEPEKIYSGLRQAVHTPARPRTNTETIQQIEAALTVRRWKRRG